MFDIKPMPQQLDEGLRSRLARLDVGTLGHCLDDGFMQPRVRQQLPGSAIVGTAVTVSSPYPDSVIGHYALKFIRPGDILVIHRGSNREVSCWGGITSRAAKKMGLTGLVMDGAGNDISQSNAVGLPVWCDGVTGVTTKYRGMGGGLNVPIQCGGVLVSPGDAIMADENGVLVIASERLENAIEKGEAIARKEAEVRLVYECDGPYPVYPDIMGATAIVEGRESQPE